MEKKKDLQKQLICELNKSKFYIYSIVINV